MVDNRVVVEFTVKEGANPENLADEIRRLTSGDHPWIPGSIFYGISSVQVRLASLQPDTETLVATVLTCMSTLQPSRELWHEANTALDELRNRLAETEKMRWFLRYRTAPEGGTQLEVYEQIDWSRHPNFSQKEVT